ncbi:bile acid:sodium symporter family protein [Robertmurraya massiliosenegalensis]|uniref:bile acid:sodium symporter family protein n=1 Tax=Robertmurraya massiliosenegalensis TaxID=1287657 RepID=UPI0003170083|nr:bile acid:sodium symporter family protein [Robertmurraya massiliosenegalensis]
MFRQLDNILVKILPIMTPVCLIIGIIVGERLEQFTFLIAWIFAFMTFSGSLGLNFRQFNHVIYHPFPLIIALLILHILVPLWNWGLGHLFFPGDPWMITGFTLLAVIPTAITSFLWTSIYKGNIPLVLSIILIDTFLAPLLVPITLKLLVGQSLTIQLGELVQDLIFMIVLPSVIAMTLNGLTKGKIKEVWGPKLSPFSKMGIFVIVFLNGGVISAYMATFSWKIMLTVIVGFIVVSSGYLFSWLISKGLKMEHETNVALTFTSGMRNNALGSVLAVTYFPSAVVLPVVLGMLFQQVMASIVGSLLYGRKQKGVSKAKSLKLAKNKNLA